MTVAAVILASPTPTGIRRLVDLAWAGGALPVVVVASDPEGVVAGAIAETEAVLVAAAEQPIESMLRGTEAAQSEVRDTSAVLLWPDRMIWVGAETVTSLLEAHGVRRDEILRPTWRDTPGWPVLVPVAALDGLRGGGLDEGDLDAIVDRLGPASGLDLGDPGAVFDATTGERDLPPYEGPSMPAGGHVHEWGDDIPEPGDAPGEGRGLAPYPQAAPGGPADV